MRALSRDPDKRYASAGEMGDELEELALRKNYSPRVLGEKARELAQAEGETAAAGTIARAVSAAAPPLLRRARTCRRPSVAKTRR